MKKIRKSQKRLITIFIIIIAIIVIIGIVGFVLKRQAPEETENQDTIITLPETQYSDMEVKNVQMEYLKENDQTSITMEIHNTTNNKVEKEEFDVLWVGENEEILGKINTQIENLETGEQHNITVVLPGNLTKTKEIKLIKK